MTETPKPASAPSITGTLESWIAYAGKLESEVAAAEHKAALLFQDHEVVIIAAVFAVVGALVGHAL